MIHKLLIAIILLVGSISAQKISEDIELIHIKDSVYIHKTWYDFPGFGRYPSNGLIFIKNGKALLIDTPVTEKQTKAICEYLKREMKVTVKEVIISHYHDDCLGGLGYLNSLKVSSVSCKLTKEKCEDLKLPIPKTTFSESMITNFEGEGLIIDHPGGGHTADNIVIYFANSKILFGGCLVKSIDSESLGNTKEAVLDEWDVTVKKVINRYRDVEVVIPGHGNFGDKELLTHTIELVRNFNDKN